MHTFVVDEAFLACRLCLRVSLGHQPQQQAGVIICICEMQEAMCCGAHQRLVTSSLSIRCRSQDAVVLIGGW